MSYPVPPQSFFLVSQTIQNKSSVSGKHRLDDSIIEIDSFEGIVCCKEMLSMNSSSFTPPPHLLPFYNPKISLTQHFLVKPYLLKTDRYHMLHISAHALILRAWGFEFDISNNFENDCSSSSEEDCIIIRAVPCVCGSTLQTSSFIRCVDFIIDNTSQLLLENDDVNLDKCSEILFKQYYMDNDLLKSSPSFPTEIPLSFFPSNLLQILPPPHAHALSTRACRGAVMFGDMLSLNQCKLLISDLYKTAHPFICAHGRTAVCPVLTLKMNVFK
jgi:DNA mismatch repair ATPase MutL